MTLFLKYQGNLECHHFLADNDPKINLSTLTHAKEKRIAAK